MITSEHPELPYKQLQKNFDQSHSNLFDNIKRVYHPQHAAREIEVIRSYSKKNLNISASQNQKKHQLQKSPHNNKSPSKLTEKSPKLTKEPSLLFTPSPKKIANKSIFRKKLTTYHNNFVENVNNNLLVSNSYSKIFRDKGTSIANFSNLAKTKSEINLLNKSQEMLSEFCYNSNTNLNDGEELTHKRPNESIIGRIKYVESPLENKFLSPELREIKMKGLPSSALENRDEELWLVRNELEESRSHVGLLKEEINKLNRENEEMQQKIIELGTQQKDVISVIVNKHQSFIEKLIADKNLLSLKCEEYLLELKQQTKRHFSFQVEMDTIKKLSSNEETQIAYTKINKELIDIQSDRGLLLDHTNIITKRPSRTADDEIMKQSRKDERRNVNFNPVPVYLNDRKI